MQVSITVDVEQDCPPYLASYRGIEEGIPRLLSALSQSNVRATFFTTGDVARRYPQRMAQVVAAGHELGCHGDTHANFGKLGEADAAHEIVNASKTLRELGPVTSFRAPYLQFPDAYLKILESEGYTLDSSRTRYKQPRGTIERRGALVRIPASTTSSVLRLPKWLRNPYFSQLADPVVLFVHPWEFVDFRDDKRLRIDCRFRTGELAVQDLQSSIAYFQARGGEFRPMRDLQVAA